MEKTVSINNKLIKDLSSQEISVLLAINSLTRSNEETLFTQSMIEYILYDGESSRRESEMILKSIELLVSKNIITLNRKIGRGASTLYVACCQQLLTTNMTTPYSYIELKYIKQIAKQDIATMKTFMAIVSSFQNTTRVGFNSQDSYSLDFNIPLRTVNRHIIKLEQMKVLYIRRNPVLSINGEVRQLNNDYGTYDNMKNVDIVADEYLASMRIVSNDTAMDANTKRRISKNYNLFLDGKFNGDIRKLIKECEKYNKYSSNKKDMSVFK